jgi:hypothetical protein
VNCILLLPYSRLQPRVFVQNALQEFTWTCEEAPAALERRARIAGGGACAKLTGEPLFCVETALEALWFSMLAYEDANEALPGVPDKDQTLPMVMQLCAVDSMVAFHEAATALHAIVAWSDRRMIVAFRGTAEAANFLADFQLCLTALPSVSLHSSADADAEAAAPHERFGERPAVHKGFMHTWTHARLNARVVSFIVERVRFAMAHNADGAPPHVLLCGHSLGGALATLAAMDFVEACGAANLPRPPLTVVTFGCPRVGSGALARHYDACVCADHWNVVNQHDVITHGGRLFGLYKHVGKRVLINPRGDMIVRFLRLLCRVHVIALCLCSDDACFRGASAGAPRLCGGQLPALDRRRKPGRRAFALLLLCMQMRAHSRTDMRCHAASCVRAAFFA